ncbi:hypothetical protein IIQ43_12685 [Acinetobacter oleivorans]|uniref:Uncharacterized protein n=1 Tax=Acinetobacter oleivorans TaxID=1148157 RepID=A0ABR9NKD5_9GAMM|nr:hypothetical protein [Acinetobacter oleivorans]MBE2165380.1 hypothetical protein [Acinetobacter oleivorans]
MNILALSSTGELSLVAGASPSLKLEFDTFSYLANAEINVAFFAKVSSPRGLADISMRLEIRDAVTGDQIVAVQGLVDGDIENSASIVAVADAKEYFEKFDLTLGIDALQAVLKSTAYNQYNSLGRASKTLALEDEGLPSFNADKLFKVLTSQLKTPAYLTLPNPHDLAVYVAAQRAATKLRIPLDAEINPTFTAEQAAQFATSVDAQSQFVQFIWSPNLCRPTDAVSLRGRKVPAYYLGHYIGDKLLRNAKLNKQGFAPLKNAVAWKDYPFTAKNLSQIPGNDLEDEQIQEMLAKAKVNVVRPVSFETTLFVLSDVLTQYQSKNSALRLVTSAEISARVTNKCIEILRTYMFQATPDYIKKAGDDIQEFLEGASSETTGWLQPAEELGGKPFEFSLVPDNDFPYERVRLYLAHGVVGTTRAAIFDEDVLVK